MKSKANLHRMIGVAAVLFLGAACSASNGDAPGVSSDAPGGDAGAPGYGAQGGSSLTNASGSGGGGGGSNSGGSSAGSDGRWGAPGRVTGFGGGHGHGHGDGGGGSSGGSSSGGSSGSSSGAGTGGGTGTWVMGYYDSWDAQMYPPSAIDWDGLTHVAAAFYVPDGNGGWASGSFDATTASQLIAAAHAHGKKAIASIGGAELGAGVRGVDAVGACRRSWPASRRSSRWATTASTSTGRAATSPRRRTRRSRRRSSTRSARRTRGIVLTLTAGYENENSLDDLTWYGTIAAQARSHQPDDLRHVGRLWQGWESWHSSPLHWNNNCSTPTGIDASVSHYLAAHVPAAKLGVGSGFYGECYTSPVTAPVQALGGSQVARATGAMSYRNIMASYYSCERLPLRQRGGRAVPHALGKQRRDVHLRELRGRDLASRPRARG